MLFCHTCVLHILILVAFASCVSCKKDKTAKYFHHDDFNSTSIPTGIERNNNTNGRSFSNINNNGKINNISRKKSAGVSKAPSVAPSLPPQSKLPTTLPPTYEIVTISAPTKGKSQTFSKQMVKKKKVKDTKSKEKIVKEVETQPTITFAPSIFQTESPSISPIIVNKSNKVNMKSKRNGMGSSMKTTIQPSQSPSSNTIVPTKSPSSRSSPAKSTITFAPIPPPTKSPIVTAAQSITFAPIPPPSNEPMIRNSTLTFAPIPPPSKSPIRKSTITFAPIPPSSKDPTRKSTVTFAPIPPPSISPAPSTSPTQITITPGVNRWNTGTLNSIPLHAQTINLTSSSIEWNDTNAKKTKLDDRFILPNSKISKGIFRPPRNV